MSSWLARQRKGDLVTIADEAGFTGYGGMLKDDLASALDVHLRDNASRLAYIPKLQEYYERAGSPVKGGRPPTGSAGPEDDGAKKRRRQTKVKDEIESPSAEETTAKALVARTPRAVQRVAERVPLPPSPAVMADAIERQTIIVRNQVGKLWKRSQITKGAETVRSLLSSVVGVEAAVILIEAYGLQFETLPWRFAFDIPLFGILGQEAFSVYLPDFFLLLTNFFWSASTLWATTSLFVPLLFGYFFNLTLKTKSSHGNYVSRPTHNVDPLTFNLAKGLITWLVYARGARFRGLFADETVERVNNAVPGGYLGVLIGAGLGAVVSIYDAVLKK